MRKVCLAMRDDSLSVTETATGEVHKDPVLKIQFPKAPGGLPPYFMVFQGSCRELAKLGLSAREWQVLFLCFEHTRFLNTIDLSQKQICAELKMASGNVSNIIKSLCAHGVLLKSRTAGGVLQLSVSPLFGFMGSGYEYKKALKKLNAQNNVTLLRKPL